MSFVYIGIDVSKNKLDCSITVDGKSIKTRKVFKNNLSSFSQLTTWTNSFKEKLQKNWLTSV